MRQSVSAEAFGVHNKKEDFVPPKVEKSAEAKKQIVERLGESFMFSGLSADEIEIVADAMSIIKPKFGECII